MTTSAPDCVSCIIYKGSLKEGTYLYVDAVRNTDCVPDALKEMLGELTHVMDLELTGERKLANADVEQVMDQLSDQGFYLQIPPPDYNPDVLPDWPNAH